MTNLNVNLTEARLTARARELSHSLADRNHIAVERSADAFDEALLAAARETSAQTLSQDLSVLRQIEAARARLRDGTYGVCAQCEEEISPKRLNAIPWAAYCISCQTGQESSYGSPPALARAA